MKRVVVIYNPFSGRKKTKNLPQIVKQNLDENIYEVYIWPTEKADDVLLLTEKAIRLKVDIVLAAGGDGTINQIASRLVNTGIVLGIIPLGSGNGFARHFKIPMNTINAIKQLPNYKIKEVDTVWVNNHCMVNIAGVGFDAHISAAFANNTKRGLKGYVKTILRHLNYKSRFYELYKNDKKLWSGNAFMIGVANATQWGNNVVLHSGAKPDDGLFNVLVLKKFTPMDFILIFKNLLEARLHTNKNMEVYTGTDFTIKRQEYGPVHVDGEPLWLGKEININIEPLSLKIFSHE
jgi:YegS/Rv2252/BmrU family lipid kinase